MTKAETKPFWMDEEEWEKKFPQMPQANIADNVTSGVPDLKDVEKGDVVGAYTIKDGLLIYHFYKKDRKAIYDAAHAEMDRLREEVEDQAEKAKLQGEVAKQANTDLEACPWWEGFEDELKAVFADVFKYQEYKISFYREVDSWSVILPEPSGVVKPSTQHLEKPFAMLALRVGAN
jgi:hypothetical protein